MASLKELQDAFIAADEAGEVEDAQFFHDEIMRMQAQGVPAAVPGVPDVPIQPVPQGINAQVPTGAGELQMYPPIPANDIVPPNPNNGWAPLDINAQTEKYGSELESFRKNFRPPSQTGIRVNPVLPFATETQADENGRMKDTKNWDWAVPGLAQGAWDSITLPGEVMRGDTDPMSEEGFARAQGLPAMVTGGSPGMVGMEGAPIATGAANMVKRALTPKPVSAVSSGSKAIDSMLSRIERRAVAERGKKTKPEIVREEGNKFFDEYEGGMTAAEKARLQEILLRGGGPVRSRVEDLANAKFTFGVEPGQITAAGLGGGMLAGKQGLDAAINMGQKVIAARLGAGVLGKTASAGARGISNAMTRNDMKDLRDLISSRPASKRLFEPVLDPSPPPAKPATVTDTPTAPVPPPPKPASVPKSVMDEYMTAPDPKLRPAPAPVPPPNPTGKIKMTTGAKTVKKTGSDPQFKAAQAQAQAEARAKAAAEPPNSIIGKSTAKEKTVSTPKQDRAVNRNKTDYTQDPKYQEWLKRGQKAKAKAETKTPSKERIEPKIAKKVTESTDKAATEGIRKYMQDKKKRDNGGPLNITVRKGPKRGRGSY